VTAESVKSLQGELKSVFDRPALHRRPAPDGIWNRFVPPNAGMPDNPAGTLEGSAEPFIPTTTDIRNFGSLIQQFRAPG